MKAVLHYLFLVGMPVLGVVGLLHMGSSLQAPASIAGKWHLEFAASALDEAGCKEVADSAVQPSLQILQSGSHLILELNTAKEMRLKGQLEALTIVTDQSETAVLQATVDRQSEPDQLAGTLTLPTCEKLVAFTGIRKPDTHQDAGGH